jgi:hypothetical protein
MAAGSTLAYRTSSRRTPHEAKEERENDNMGSSYAHANLQGEASMLCGVLRSIDDRFAIVDTDSCSHDC